MNAALKQAVAIRPEGATDVGSVRSILDEAFVTSAEAELVEWLRAEGALVLALVAQAVGGRIVGFIGFPRLSLEPSRGSTPAIGLAPLAVAPDMQRRGIGTALCEEGLARLAALGEQIVFVVGEPAYYRRFGFVPDAAGAFESPYAGTHFMVRRLTNDAPRAGTLRYPRAFADLG